jgi:hypothetical protein
MQQGVELIYRGVLLADFGEAQEYLSRQRRKPITNYRREFL